MSEPVNYSRIPFRNRPHITGKLYEDLKRPGILHLDAYTLNVGALKYLLLDWRESGRERLALDAYLVEPDGLTPVWDAEKLSGVQCYWNLPERSLYAELHMRVLAEAAKAQDTGRWSRVSLWAHYVYVRESDPERGLEPSKPRGAYKRKLPPLADIL
jgi:hypothetical protein